jgi:pimeloyl-ACP methyl ester carboxylesterase
MPESVPAPASENSTNVRLKLTRLAVGALATLAPRTAERWAFDRFCTPVRPRPARPPRVPGLPAHSFTVAFTTPAGARQLRAWDWGEGPTVLLAHGWSGYAGQMTAFVPALVAAGYHVVAFDQPAHGQSGGRTTTLLELRQAVLAVGSRFSAFQPLAGVVAHSLGATATLLALDRGLRAERAVLLAPPADPLPFVQAAGHHFGLPPAGVKALSARIHGYLRADIGERDAHAVIASLDVPLLVVHDEQDRAVPFEVGRALAAASPRVEFLAPRGLGHRRLLADPTIIGQAVDFLQGRRTAPARTAAGR